MGWPIYSARSRRVLVRTQPEARHANTRKPSRQPVSRGREKNRSSRFKKRKSRRRRRCCCCDAIVLPVVARQPICQLFHANVPVRDATHCQPLPSSSSSISGSSPPIPCSGSPRSTNVWVHGPMPTLPVLVDGGRASRSSRSELGLRGFGMVGSSFSPLSRFFHFEEAVDWFSDRFQEEIGNCLRLEISVQGGGKDI